MLVETMKINKKEVNIVTSLDVAETFGKDHYHVMEDIRVVQSKISTPEFSGLFYESVYIASNGKKNPMFYMNRDGFTLLVMGYGGEKAMKFKLAYIKQFNAMEELLKGKLLEREKRIVIPAIFTPEEEGGYSVFFPDLEGCYTCGDDLQDALFMAEDVLAFVLYDYEAEGRAIPVPTKAEDVEKSAGEFVNYVACDTIEYARMHNNKAVKKTLTIPQWLNDMAIRQDINFSQVLQEALMQKVNTK